MGLKLLSLSFAHVGAGVLTRPARTARVVFPDLLCKLLRGFAPRTAEGLPSLREHR